jgi:cytidyltransferase-like protein
MSNYAQIVSLDDFEKIRTQLGRIVCASGGFDPLHPGHTTYIIESKKFGDTLVVVVKGDEFLRCKKGKPFMDLQDRCKIISCLREVDYVIPFELENDSSVNVALRCIRPNIYTKGGDREDYTNFPEWSVCQELGIQLIPRVGLPKNWHSSEFLRKWGIFWEQNH